MKNIVVCGVIAVSTVTGVAGFVAAEGREPTKGYVPDAAFENGRVKLDSVPDYIVAYTRDGDVAGYVRATEVLVDPPGRIRVVDEGLSRTVGFMVPGRGFVPVGTPDEAIPKFERVPVPAETEMPR